MFSTPGYRREDLPFLLGKSVWRQEDSLRLKEIMISSEETNLGVLVTVGAYSLYHIMYAALAASRKAGVSQK